MSQTTASDSVFADASVAFENPSLPLNVATEDLSCNRDAWKFDKDCSLCHTTFGVLKMQHKYRCKFCYRGVCVKCSKYRVLHPEQGLERRCCSACYEKFISSVVREEFQGRLSMSQERVSMIERKLTNVQDNRADAGEGVRLAITEMNRLRHKNSQLEYELEKLVERQNETKKKLDRQRKAMESMKEDRLGKVSVVRTRTQKCRQEIDDMSQMVAEAMKAIASSKTELAQIQEEEVRLMRLSEKRNKALETAKDLKFALSTMEIQCKSLESQNESTKSQLRAMEKELKMMDGKHKEMEPVELITRTRGESSYDSEIDIERDKEKFRELTEENDELRRQYQEMLANSQLTFNIKPFRKEGEVCKNVSPTETREPRSCGCLLF